MAGRAIELKSISCRGVKSFVPLQKPSLYAVVSVPVATGHGGIPEPRREQKTPVDRDSGENPEWDHPMRIDLDDTVDFLQFDVTAQIPLLGDKVVGTARVAVADLEAPIGVTRHVSYQVQAPDGKPNGVLSFSYKMESPEVSVPVAAAAPPFPLPVAGYFPTPNPAAYYTRPMPESRDYYPPPVANPTYPPLPDLSPHCSYPPPPPPPPPPTDAAAYYPPSAPPLPDVVNSYPSPEMYHSKDAANAYYPPPGTQHPAEAARAPNCPPPGTRHPAEAAGAPYYPPPGTRHP